MWDRSYGTGNSWACAMVETSDGGYAIAGTDNYDFRLVKIDAFGDMEWDITFGGLGGDWVSSLVATADGGYAIAGYTYASGGAGLTDFWLVKTDSLGNIQWDRKYGSQLYDMAYSLIATSDGGYAIAGTTNGGWGAFLGDVWLVKTDASGNMQWNKTYGKTWGSDTPYSLVATSDGGYAIAGTTNGDFCLVKTDALGNMQWNKTYGGVGDDWPCSVIATSDGGYAIAGTTNVINNTSGDFWLIKTDTLGDAQWNQTYRGTEAASATSLIATHDGGYAIAGYTSSIGVGPGFYWGGDVWFVKTDADGNMEWNQTYGGTGNDWACSVVATSDGGYGIAGTWNNTNWEMGLEAFGTVYYGDFWFVKTDENGVIPEYSSWLIPALVLTATAFVIINKKRLLNKHPQKP